MMLARLSAALSVHLALAQKPETNPIIQIDIFRAMTAADRNRFVLQDDDIADIGGALKYVVTEVLAESDVPHVPAGPGTDPHRNWPDTRKYGIDAVVRYRFKVHTPKDIIDVAGAAGLADFGPFVTFDQGVSSNAAFIKYTKQYGEYVGIQIQPSAERFVVGQNMPVYWFSAVGLCPNIAFKGLKDPVTGATSNGKGTQDAPANGCMRYGWKSNASSQYGDCKTPCPAGWPTDECWNKCTKMNPDGSNKCPYPDHCYDNVVGGLCPKGSEGADGESVPKVDPAGHAGCVYSYGRPDFVLFDDVAGLTQEDCGGRKCKDWKDFRKSCTNDEYKKKFDPAGNIIDATETPGVATPLVCVEYDMHPYCRLGAGCDDPRCVKMRAEGTQIEVGVPWWRGRCEPLQNRKRMEGIMAGFSNPPLAGAGKTHLLVDQELMTSKYQRCLRPADGPINNMLCNPNPAQGGPYCYRGFSGICQMCKVPNTKQPNPAWMVTAPQCPIGAVSMPEYEALPKPTCASTKVADLCCLYTGTCEGESDPTKAAISDDAAGDEGWMLVAARESTDDMMTYMNRIANCDGADAAKLKDLAYWSWLPIPEPRSLKTLKADMTAAGCAAGPGPAPSPGPGPSPSSGGGPPVTLIVIILAILLLGGGGAVVYFKFLKPQPQAATDPMLEAAQQS